MIDHPLATIALITYKQERFVTEAIRGALAQTYEPLEILIADDCSPDNTFAVIEQTVAGYAGLHRVHIHRNERNLGIGANVNAVVSRARGEFIVMAAGDDISRPDRVSRLMEHYIASGKRALSIFTNCVVIDEYGREEFVSEAPDPRHLTLEYIARQASGVHGATQGFARSLYDLGPMDPGVVYEDTVIPFRAALLGEVAYLHEPLVKYRKHDANVGYTRPQDLSPAKLLSDTKRLCESWIAAYRTRLSDIALVADLKPERCAEMSELRALTERALRDVSRERALLDEPGIRGPLRIMAEALRDGTDPFRVGRWALTRFAPRAYLVARDRLQQLQRLRT